MRIIMLIASAVALTMTSAQAQDVGSMGGIGSGGFGGRHHGQQQKKGNAATSTPKADEKAYNAALKGIPGKPYDPWHGIH
jgi:opacity protein-like surface antigen